MSPATSPGTVHLVGAGPGAADLLTLRAWHLLRRADCVFHDALVDSAVLDFVPHARRFPVGKRSGAPSSQQAFINRQLIQAARQHTHVVRLKGGDPMMFGRAQEEIDALRGAGIPVEVVPGVSAGFAAAAALGTSLTQRGISRSVVFLTPAVGRNEPTHDWARPAAAADTVVMYMAAGQAAAIRAGLLAAGLPESHPVAMIEDASLSGESIHTGRLHELEALTARRRGGPAILVFGHILESLAATVAPMPTWTSAHAA